MADRLRKAREAAGLEQAQLGELMAYSRQAISSAERGVTTPRRIVLRAWAMATGVPVEWLETGEAPPAGPEGPGTYTARDSNPEPAGSGGALVRGRLMPIAARFKPQLVREAS